MSERNILQEIVDRRIKDMEVSGLEFGFKIPAERNRKVHAFMDAKGAILEVKRASPSKGDIAPDLNSYDTALDYSKAGAKAISCLTETNYFKGTLQDLMNVCKAVDDYEAATGKTGPAVLRKDFLINAQEVEVAYRAGADAVLLISRILDLETMISMAKKCEELGISALVEVRLNEDVEKLAKVAACVNTKYIVAGVNSRDLRDFSIDLLTPCALLKKIKAVLGENARVIFESGIRTPESAAFAGSLGFSGMLLGEAAAKNPDIRSELVNSFTESKTVLNSNFWNKYSETKEITPKVKICGLTNREDVLSALNYGADFLGFIFWKKSPRCADSEVVKSICKELKKSEKCPVLTGVIVDPDLKESQEAIELVKEGVLDVLQLHTIDCARKFLKDKTLRQLPHYAAINISSEDEVKLLDELFDQGEPRVLVDAKTESQIGGTGKQISSDLLQLVQKKYKLWIAGGITGENAAKVIADNNPELVDIASGIEAVPGKKDPAKMEKLFKEINK